jgi:pimeloyl-ACP methyl ester carboxylesterase
MFTLVLALLGWLPPGASAQSGPHFEEQACPFNVPAGMSITCGVVRVAEQRADPASRQIALFVAIARAQGRARAADPLVYLAGGPGSPAVRSTASLARGWAAFLGNRDLVVVDQRGVGFSEPSLNCPEAETFLFDTLDDDFAPGQRVAAEAAALEQCRRRLAEAGVDLSAYTTSAAAADLDDIRVALGYQRWNILGISYGTRLALAYVRDHADVTRSLVLDSLYPPQENLITSLPSTLDHSIRMLVSGCAASKRCRTTYPRLEEDLNESLVRLDAQPVMIDVVDPRTGATLSERVDGSRVVEILFRSLYSSASIPELPRMLTAVRQGNFAPIAELETQRLARSFGSSQALYYAVQCPSDIAAYTDEQADQAARSVPRLERYYRNLLEMSPAVRPLCRAMAPSSEAAREREPVRSDVPALLLAGAYDPITPNSWAASAARTLSKSYMYTFPGTGHAVITRGACPISMITAFLDRPQSAPPAGCIRKLGGPAWVTP